ncbi:MAG TPA: flagellar hook capping FlgD N-terminal domain-containing protein [Bryobacteraceae bacterium]|nr:flagellar hook capping FlgD N-terminal domain-containing protein [Bryobacteraceae bacterium]
MTPAIASSGSNPANGASNPAGSSANSSSALTNGANEDTFMQLLVAELENQDPSNPADGTEFVTQLAEFQQLTTSMNMATSISNIQNDTDQLVKIMGGTPAGSNSSSAGTGGTSGTQS